MRICRVTWDRPLGRPQLPANMKRPHRLPTCPQIGEVSIWHRDFMVNVMLTTVMLGVYGTLASYGIVREELYQ